MDLDNRPQFVGKELGEHGGLGRQHTAVELVVERIGLIEILKALGRISPHTQIELGALGGGLGFGLAAAVLIECGGRIGIGRASFGDVLHRAAGLPRAAWGMTLAHFGFAVIVAGAAGASIWQDEATKSLKVGESVSLAGYEFTLRNVDDVRGPNYIAQRGVFSVRHDGERLTVLAPERRRYIVPGTETTEAALYSNGIADLYAVLGQQDGPGRWVAKVYFKPLVPWLWIGSVLTVLGGFVSLTDRRLRVGAPTRRDADPVRATPAPAE